MYTKNETVFDLTMALACILLGGISLFLLLRPGTTYVSGKSFWWARLTKEKQKKKSNKSKKKEKENSSCPVANLATTLLNV